MQLNKPLNHEKIEQNFIARKHSKMVQFRYKEV